MASLRLLRCGSFGLPPSVARPLRWTRPYSTPLSDPENRGRPQRKVNFDLLGAWDNRLELPILLERSIKEGKPIPKIRLSDCGFKSVIGRRQVNEDRIVAKWLTSNESEILYVAIFDGHSGVSACDYLWKFMDRFVQYALLSSDDLEYVLKQSFINVGNTFNRHLHYAMTKLMRLPGSLHYDRRKGAAADMLGGSTATVCLLKESSELYVAHVGDSRALLCREGKALQLFQDHEPEVPSEKARIKARGGHIASNSLGAATVNGRLAMTRSIGDVDLKASGVTAVPDIDMFNIKHSRDGFLVLTTDGITNVLGDQEIVDYISSCPDPQEAASLITDQALHYGADDNSSVIVVPFGAWGKYAPPSGPGSFMTGWGRNIIGKSYV